LWQQWGSIEIERAERQRLQVAWMLAGALDWSRLILREDARTGAVDHLGEPWAMVLEESRLSTFLAADRNNNAGFALEDTLDAFLSGHVEDAQSKLNISNLLEGAQISATHKASFTKLFEVLGLPSSELQQLCEQLLQASTRQSGNANAPLMPQRMSQLVWLGISAETLKRLEPYVTLLPKTTPVNLNTAPTEVLYASIPKADRALASRLIQRRQSQPFTSLEAAATAVGLASSDLNPLQHAVGSQYFFVWGRMRLEQTTIQEVSLIERHGRSVTTLWRERGVLP
jgi:general secretion pathway protein K